MSTARRILSFSKPTDPALRIVFTPRPTRPRGKYRVTAPKHGVSGTQSIAGLCIAGISVQHKLPRARFIVKPTKKAIEQRTLKGKKGAKEKNRPKKRGPKEKGRPKGKNVKARKPTRIKMKDGSVRPPEVVGERLMGMEIY